MENLYTYILKTINESADIHKLDFYLNLSDVLKIKNYEMGANQLMVSYKCSEKQANEIIKIIQSDNLVVISDDEIKRYLSQNEYKKFKKLQKKFVKKGSLNEEKLRKLQITINEPPTMDIFTGQPEESYSEEDKFLFDLLTNCAIHQLNIGFEKLKCVKFLEKGSYCNILMITSTKYQNFLDKIN